MGKMQTHGNYTYDATCPNCVAAETRAKRPDNSAYPYADGDTVVLGPETLMDWPDQTTICHKGENYTRQPDRPEPVDPASVREGDHVEVTYLGWVDKDGWVRSHDDDSCLLAPIESQEHAKTVRVLHRPEPEPDEAAVELWADALSLVWSTGEVSETDREVARNLIRELARRGVHVEVPSDA